VIKMGNKDQLKDSGSKRVFDTGYQRDNSTGKGRYDLIPGQMTHRLAKHYQNGAVKYGDNNWRNGCPWSVMLDCALRHLNKYAEGWNDEDHLAAALWNIAALTHFEVHNQDQNDLPGRQLSSEELTKFSWKKED